MLEKYLKKRKDAVCSLNELLNSLLFRRNEFWTKFKALSHEFFSSEWV